MSILETLLLYSNAFHYVEEIIFTSVSSDVFCQTLNLLTLWNDLNISCLKRIIFTNNELTDECLFFLSQWINRYKDSTQILNKLDCTIKFVIDDDHFTHTGLQYMYTALLQSHIKVVLFTRRINKK